MATESIIPRETHPAWTHFWDMSSGGEEKTKFEHIFIELPDQEAKEYFELRFGRDPDHVTCDCCGNDFSVSEAETLVELIPGILRGGKSIKDFLDQDDVLVIYQPGNASFERPLSPSEQ